MTLQLTVTPSQAEQAAPGNQTQYLRKCALTVVNAKEALDLSALRIKFNTYQSDVQTPNSAVIRIFNLNDTTAKRVQQEFQKVTLSAGYQNGPFGVIFAGTIKQVRRGRVDPTDTYLDILAADGDEGYNFGVIQKALAPGWKPDDVLEEGRKAINADKGYTANMTVAAASRGKVMYGMARDYLRTLTRSQGMVWSVQDGKLQLVPLTSYVPGRVVALNGQSGMIGLPEQTEGGITVKCLINPAIRIGSAIQINDASIQRAFLGGNYLYAQGRLEQLPGFNSLLPKISNDGLYRVYVAEFSGDTRGHEWYEDIVCLAIDKSAPAGQQVQKAATQ